MFCGGRDLSDVFDYLRVFSAGFFIGMFSVLFVMGFFLGAAMVFKGLFWLTL